MKRSVGVSNAAQPGHDSHHNHPNFKNMFKVPFLQPVTELSAKGYPKLEEFWLIGLSTLVYIAYNYCMLEFESTFIKCVVQQIQSHLGVIFTAEEQRSETIEH